ncbi:Casanova [Mortierella polycephala]|uniref:Casanova n=1 Tax=Mortierella polycephala TaxID=41804 RepID=A0A9P6QIG4_9FUNG|nr:Casanova [Mortierella polycephala]
MPSTTAVKGMSPTKKIPRPPNSFLIYRKEHATRYAGLVATQLSTKLAEAWRKETPERRAYYAMLAEKAKQEHATKYPDYKFTPIKRGTGKRALALAASASAAMKAVGNPTAASKSCGATTTAKSRVAPRTTVQTVPSMDRPRRTIQRPQRFSSGSPYARSSISYRRASASSDLLSSSLLFQTRSTLQWLNNVQATQDEHRIQHSTGSPTFSASSASPTLSYGDSELSDIDAEGEEDEDEIARQITHGASQLIIQENDHSSSSRYERALPSPSYQEDTSLFGVPTYPSLLSMENFEPECLARDDVHWSTMSFESCSVLSTPSMSACSTTSSLSDGYLTPSYEEGSQTLQLPLDTETTASSALPMSTSISSTMMGYCVDTPTTSGLVAPFSTPLYPSMTLSPQVSNIHLSSASLNMPLLTANDDLIVSPVLASCPAALSPLMSHNFLPEQDSSLSYIVGPLEWL